MRAVNDPRMSCPDRYVAASCWVVLRYSFWTMILTEAQRLRLNLTIQERELASLLNNPNCDLREIAITQGAIDRLKAQLGLSLN